MFDDEGANYFVVVNIEEVWTDMRPKSVRDAMDGADATSEGAGSLLTQGSRMVLSQLVDADELKAMSPEELRDMLASLDDDVIYAEDREGEDTELRATTPKPEA